jgi:Zn-finger nucleic acid-binding protein
LTAAAPNCPRCRRDLDVVSTPGSTTYRCPACSGRAVTVGMLRRFAPPEHVDAAWQATWRNAPETGGACPFCARPMRTVTLDDGTNPLVLDACRGCEAIWFDDGELAAFSPERQAPPTRAHLVSETDVARALRDVRADADALHGREEHRAGWDRGPTPASVPWFVQVLTRLIGPKR